MKQLHVRFGLRLCENSEVKLSRRMFVSNTLLACAAVGDCCDLGMALKRREFITLIGGRGGGMASRSAGTAGGPQRRVGLLKSIGPGLSGG
jgi:hypothetical protein